MTTTDPSQILRHEVKRDGAYQVDRWTPGDLYRLDEVDPTREQECDNGHFVGTSELSGV